jgi:hypothetical protein
MVDLQKIGMYVFILGALIAIFSGAFPILQEMTTLRVLFMIITGTFVGLLNISKEQEFGFLIATGVFIIASRAIDYYLKELILLSNLNDIIFNLIIFVSSAAVVVALKLIFRFASQHEPEAEEQELPKEFEVPLAEEAWNFTVFVAVVLIFVIFILEAFFFTGGLGPFLTVLTYIVLGVFVIDLFVLYRKARHWKIFLKRNWLDIIAVIPLGSVFSLAKLFRFVKIAKVISQSSRLSKLTKMHHSTKFFSSHSGFNKYLKKKR